MKNEKEIVMRQKHSGQRHSTGLTTALVGMKQVEHVEENLGVAKIPPAPVEDFLKLFEVDSR